MINKSKRMVDIVSLGDLSHSAPGDVLSKYVKSVQSITTELTVRIAFRLAPASINIEVRKCRKQ